MVVKPLASVHGEEDPLDLGPTSDDGTKVWMCCAALCSPIHVLPIFLADESDCYIYSLGKEFWVIVVDDFIVSCVQN